MVAMNWSNTQFPIANIYLCIYFADRATQKKINRQETQPRARQPFIH